jgi:hypothetical protein
MPQQRRRQVRGQEGEGVAAGGAPAAQGGPPGVTGPGGREGPAAESWELTATDDYVDGSELVQVVGQCPLA